MTSPNISLSLLKRESGFSLITQKDLKMTWSSSPSKRIRFPAMNDIISFQAKQNILTILKANGDGFILNEFEPENLVNLNRENEHILKLSILENSCLFVISKKNTKSHVSFYLQDFPFDLSRPRLPILKDLQVKIEEIEHFDAVYSNLVVRNSGRYLVFDVTSGELKYEKDASNCVYCRGCICLTDLMEGHLKVSIINLSSFDVKIIEISDMRPIEILDVLNDSIIFTQGASLFANFIGSTPHLISAIPSKFFIGRFLSIASYLDEVIFMSSGFPKVDLRPSFICADILDLIVVYEKVNSRVVILNEVGEILQTLEIVLKLVFIAVNPDTFEIFQGSKTEIQVLDYI